MWSQIIIQNGSEYQAQEVNLDRLWDFLKKSLNENLNLLDRKCMQPGKTDLADIEQWVYSTRQILLAYMKMLHNEEKQNPEHQYAVFVRPMDVMRDVDVGFVEFLCCHGSHSMYPGTTIGNLQSYKDTALKMAKIVDSMMRMVFGTMLRLTSICLDMQRMYVSFRVEGYNAVVGKEYKSEVHMQLMELDQGKVPQHDMAIMLSERACHQYVQYMRDNVLKEIRP